MLPKSHIECRSSLCIGCHKLGSTLRKILPNSTVVKKVKEHIYDGFSLENSGLPCTICGGCRQAVLKGKFKKKFNYDKLIRSMPRGHSSDRCQCYICAAVRSDKNLRHLPNHSPQKKSSHNPKNPTKSKPIKVCSR